MLGAKSGLTHDFNREYLSQKEFTMTKLLLLLTIIGLNTFSIFSQAPKQEPKKEKAKKHEPKKEGNEEQKERKDNKAMIKEDKEESKK